MKTKKLNLFLVLIPAITILMAGNIHAVNVDIYQDCESGNHSQLLTPSIMDASSHGMAGWMFYSSTTWYNYCYRNGINPTNDYRSDAGYQGYVYSLFYSTYNPYSNYLCVSTNCAMQLPGTVTIGTMTYTDTATRSWMFHDDFDATSVTLVKSNNYSKVTYACFYTPGENVTFYNQCDTLIMGNNPFAVQQTVGYPWSGGPFLRCHSTMGGSASTFAQTGINVNYGHTYWVNIHWDGTTGLVYNAVYDPDNNWALLGIVSTATKSGSTINLRFQAGRADQHRSNLGCLTTSYISNILIAFDNNAIFPLLPDGIGAVDTSSPTAPAEVNDGAGADISSTFSTSTLSANWTASVDTETGIDHYQYAISSTTDNRISVLGWTNTGNVLTVTNSSLNLVIGTTYYFSVRAINGAGLTGSAANSDGQYVSPDNTPPVGPSAVRDGATPGVDVSSTISVAQLSANWNAATDAESGIGHYEYAISSTTDNRTSILGWTGVGTNTTITKTGLTLTAGNTYYFSVRAYNGAGLPGAIANSDGQLVISTMDVTPPTSVGTVRDGTGSDLAFTQSNNTLSANWDAATDPESNISRYDFAISSTIDNRTNILEWTSNGINMGITKSGLSLTTGTTYYFSVRAINGVGLAGPISNSNGQYIVAVDTSDKTPPAKIVVVRDGTGAADISFTYSLITLTANWDASSDPESGIARYWFAIGTISGGTDVSDWIDNGQLTRLNVSGFSLMVGATYYISVKAENGAGLQSQPTSSNGQVVIQADTTTLVISEVSAQNITTNGASLTWQTNKPSTSQVEYGRTTNYGTLTIENTALLSAHSVLLTGLVANTLYHYSVISLDASGNETDSVDYTFTTLNSGPVNPEVHAYPNPYKISSANPVKFCIKGMPSGEVDIYTVSGRLIKKQAGATEISWDGKNTDGEKAQRGIYIYKITSGTGDSVTGKLVLTK